MTDQDRREFSRVDIELQVELHADGHRQPDARTRDLSAIGAVIETGRLLPVGTSCRLSLSPAGTQQDVRIRVEGLVARVSDGALGIEFTSIDPESYEHLRHILCFHADDPDAIERELREHLGIRRHEA